MQIRKIAYNSLALLIGLAVALAAAEIATRLVRPQRLSGSWFVIGPLGTYVNKGSGTATHVLADRAVTYEFNSWHQRSREEPNASSVRALVLGDSFTFGIGLAIENTYVGLLQRGFDDKLGKGRLQLLNAATGGSGTADHLAYLEAFGDRLAPSAVIEFVSGDDFDRAVQRGVYQVTADGKMLTAVDRSAERSGLKKFLEDNRLYDYLLEHSHFVQLVRNAFAFGRLGTINLPAASTAGDDRDLLEQHMARLLFRRMAAWCAARNVQLTVLTTGWPWKHYPWLADMLSEEGIYFRDLKNDVAGVIGPDLANYMIAGDGHPNERGAALIEAAAWPVLEARLAGLTPK